MKSNREILRESRALIKGAAFWRILAVVLNLLIAYTLAMFAIKAAYAAFGVPTVETWAEAHREMLRGAGAAMPALPGARESLRMMGGSAFMSFVRYLFGGIMTFGVMGLMLCVVRREGENWNSRAFAGVKRPLSLCWLTFLMALKIALWSLLFIVPGIVAALRYALAWYVKVDRPELTANGCLKESGRLMYGHKWQFFGFTAFFAVLAACAFLPVLAVAGFGIGGPVALSAAFALVFMLEIYVWIYAGVAQAQFYLETLAVGGAETAAVENCDKISVNR